MIIIEEQFRRIDGCFPKQRGNVAVSNLDVLNAIRDGFFLRPGRTGSCASSSLLSWEAFAWFGQRDASICRGTRG